MQATTQLKDIINEQNRYVQVVQGGKWWQYWTTGNYLNYEFSTTHYVDDHNLAKIYYVIAKVFYLLLLIISYKFSIYFHLRHYALRADTRGWIIFIHHLCVTLLINLS